MQASQDVWVQGAELGRARREGRRPGGCGPALHRQEEGPATDLGSETTFLRLPRAVRFAEGGVVTLQHWLDLNA